MSFRSIFSAKPGDPGGDRHDSDRDRPAWNSRLRRIFGLDGANGITADERSAPPRAMLSGSALHLLDRLRLNTGALLLSGPAGSRSSPLRKPASDFRDQRRYVPGDDVRFVDWKASARQEHVFIKQGEQEKAVIVYILIDLSASMAWGAPPKSHAALALAHALGYLALAQNDRLVIVPVTGGDPALRDGRNRAPDVIEAHQNPAKPDQPARGGPSTLGPLWGKGQAPGMISYLQALRFNGRVNLAGALAALSKRGLSRGGLVLVISDLLETDGLAEALAALPAPAWQVVVCHLLHPDELEPSLDGHYQMMDIESGRRKYYSVTSKALETYRQNLEAWQSGLMHVCREHKAFYTRLSSGWSLEKELIPHLVRDGVIKPL